MTKYLVDPTNYKGSVISTMSTPDTVDYSLELYGKAMTFEEYKEFKQLPNLQLMTWEELEPIHRQYENSLCKPWSEITEERYYEMLECLPPGKWHDLNERFNIFHCIEAYTGSLNSHFVKDRQTGKYYEALRSRFTKDEEFINQLNQL